jgi:hypothetical protein
MLPGRSTRIARQHGRLIRRHHEAVEVVFTSHGATMGRSPAYLELHDVTDALAPDEVVEIVGDNGLRYLCGVLDHTNFCFIIESASGEH